MKEFKLYNRYRISVILKQLEDNGNEYLLEVPEKELQWVQVSYDLIVQKDENGEEQKIEKDYSVDPSGGPFIALGENRLSLYPSGELIINVEEIHYDKNKGYILKISELSIK